MAISEVIKRIRGYRATCGYSIRGFAMVVGVSEGTLRQIDSEAWNPRLSTLKRCEGVIPPGFSLAANENDDGNGGGGCCARAGGCKSAAA